MAKRLAPADGTSIDKLIEEGLRHVVSSNKPPREFRLRKASFKGRGMASEAMGSNWEHLRDLAYKGRGG